MHWRGSSLEPGRPCGDGGRSRPGKRPAARFLAAKTPVFLACLVVPAFVSVSVAVSSIGVAAEAGADSLESFLVSQLRVRTPADTRFLERVAGAVLNGRLPETVVRSTCEWAIQKADRTGGRYPFPYFRSAIVLKARRLGVEF